MLQNQFYLKILLLLGLLLALLLPIISTKVTSAETTKLASIISRVFNRRGGGGEGETKVDTAPSWSETSSTTTTANMTSKRTPVYFLSHGGPNIMEEIHHPAYAQLQTLGREITHTIKPKAVVVFSAHWQAHPSKIQVNTAASLPLVYDYYGFPPHFYEVEYPNRGSPELAQRVIALLEQAGIQAEGVERGLDHGVFASFLCAFHPEKNPLGVPLVQVSLFDSEDPERHYALGEAVGRLREEGVVVIGTGMAVHNTRDFRKLRARGDEGVMPYVVSFDAALKVAVELPVERRRRAMVELLKRPDARSAHPSFEHLLPVHIGAGAAGEDVGRQVWTKPEGSLSWAMYRFGEVGA